MEPVIYLDNNATTRPAPEVVEAQLPWLREQHGNPSSSHVLGLQAEGALVQARAQVAAFLGGQPAEIVFTSGGTEALNHALRGAAEAFPAKRHLDHGGGAQRRAGSWRAGSSARDSRSRFWAWTAKVAWILRNWKRPCVPTR